MAKNKRMIRFGGPGLPAGRLTWYLRYDANGTMNQMFARPGDTAEADGMLGGGEAPCADDFVARGMAEYMDEAPAARGTGPKAEEE